MSTPYPPDVYDFIGRVAPGTALREAISLILHQESGALVVIGTGSDVDAVCAGGFGLASARFTPQRLAELAKMDGGLVVDDKAEYIVRANVHFMPDPSIDTSETGTRFRTAERVARQTGRPVLAISENRSRAVVFLGERGIELQSATTLLVQANQALNSMERLRRRVSEAEDRLTRSEIEDTVVVVDVVRLLQRAAMLLRLHADLSRLEIELGEEAQLIRLQAADLLEGVEQLVVTVYTDYVKRRPKRRERVLDVLDSLDNAELLDPDSVIEALKLAGPDTAVRPRGYRVLAQIPRLPDAVKESLVAHFHDLQRMLDAGVVDLSQVEGVGETRALQLRRYFDRLTEASSLWS